MLQVANQSPFTAALSVFPDPQGVETAYAIIKATFELGAEEPKPAEKQLPLLASDVFWGDPVQTSLRAAGDFALLKPATDVLLIGRAIAQAPNTRMADVRLRVGPVNKTVRVFGDRVWEGTGSKLRPSEPKPWDRMPLRWELAYGGVCPSGDGAYEARNPVGRGFAGKDAGALKGLPVPNLEEPSMPIGTSADRPAPACFAPIAPTWMPRRAHAGTYDEAWTAKRAPYLPLDFDPRYFQLAPSGLIAPGFLQGGEPVELVGFSMDGPITFALPDCGLETTFDFDGASVPKPAQLELILFEPDAGRFQMLWRSALPVDKKLLKLRQVQVRSRAYARDGRKISPLGALTGLPGSYASA